MSTAADRARLGYDPDLPRWPYTKGTTMAQTPATHALLDGRGAAYAVGTEDDLAQKLEAGLRLVALEGLDVAALATIAAYDDPRLTKRGDGFLGAGTHPAQPYLSAMTGMRGVTRSNIREVHFGYDNAADIVNRFCGESSTWKGDTARAVKAVLRSLIARG